MSTTYGILNSYNEIFVWINLKKKSLDLFLNHSLKTVLQGISLDRKSELLENEIYKALLACSNMCWISAILNCSNKFVIWYFNDNYRNMFIRKIGQKCNNPYKYGHTILNF